MAIYKLHPGIASLITVTCVGIEWSVIYIADDKPLEVYKGANFRAQAPLPDAVIVACQNWFARVFALPVGKRGKFIRDNVPYLPDGIEVADG